MSSQTSLVARQVRLQQWADQIRDCQNRPAGMKVDTWGERQGITKANYYYRLKCVREACLSMAAEHTESVFVEVPALSPAEPVSVSANKIPSFEVSAILHMPSGMSIELCSGASPEFIRALIQAVSHAE